MSKIDYKILYSCIRENNGGPADKAFLNRLTGEIIFDRVRAEVAPLEWVPIPRYNHRDLPEFNEQESFEDNFVKTFLEVNGLEGEFESI